MSFHSSDSIVSVIWIFSMAARPERYWKSTSRLETSRGTSMWKAQTSYLSRVHTSGVPFALMVKPASIATGPLGE